jgi:hypothetical protein
MAADEFLVHVIDRMVRPARKLNDIRVPEMLIACKEWLWLHGVNLAASEMGFSPSQSASLTDVWMTGLATVSPLRPGQYPRAVRTGIGVQNRMSSVRDDDSIAKAIELGFEPDRFRRGRFTIEARGGGLWAVLEDDAFCLNREGEFEYEPQPSARDKAFLKRCRFSLQEALVAASAAASSSSSP